MKQYRRFKKVPYKITDDFGLYHEIGDVIDAYLLAECESSGTAILLHPAERKECASIDFARMNRKGQYESIDTSAYVNLSKKDLTRLKL